MNIIKFNLQISFLLLFVPSAIHAMVMGIANPVKDPKIQLGKQLVDAAAQQEWDQLRGLIARGADVNQKCTEGKTALMYAAIQGCVEKARLLAIVGADINLHDNEGKTALMHAALHWHNHTVSLLLEHRAKKDLRDKTGMTALMHAAKMGRIEIVRMLIHAGANLELQSNRGQTALMIAGGVEYPDYSSPNYYVLECARMITLAMCDQTEMMLNKGSCYKNCSVRSLERPLYKLYAQIQDLQNDLIKVELLKIVNAARGFDHEWLRNFQDGQELVLAAKNCDWDDVDRMIRRGADLNRVCKRGRTPLMWTIDHECFTYFEKLIEAGADLNKQNNDGQTALLFLLDQPYVLTGKRKSFLNRLLDAGVDIHVAGGFGTTPLILVARTENVIATQALIARNAKVDAQDSDGLTALMYAAACANNVLVCMLLDAGARRNMQDSNGKTALIYAVDNQTHLVVCELIIRGADIFIQDKKGKTALMYSAAGREDKGTITSTLIARAGRSLVNIRDQEGKTALMYAAFSGNKKIAKILIEAKADLNIQSNDGKTALMHAVIAGNKEIAKMLIEANADLHVRSKEEQTALMIAGNEDQGMNCTHLIANAIHEQIKNRLFTILLIPKRIEHFERTNTAHIFKHHVKILYQTLLSPLYDQIEHMKNDVIKNDLLNTYVPDKRGVSNPMQ